MENNTLPVIIIDFNSADRTARFIKESRDFFSGMNPIYVVVDNSCRDENYAMLRSLLFCHSNESGPPGAKMAHRNQNGDIFLICASQNHGFAKSNNIGYIFAKGIVDFEFAIFSNNDIQFPDKTSVGKLISAFDVDDTIGLIGPRMIGLNGKPQSPCRKISLYDRWWKTQLAWPFGKYLGVKGTNDLAPLDRSDYVYRVIGAFMLVKAHAFEEAGMFDEMTFLYAEEPILSERLLRQGYKTYYCNEVTIIHEGGYTTTPKNGMINIKKIQRSFDSEMYYYKTYIKISSVTETLTRMIFSIYCLKIKLVNAFRKIRK